MPLCWAQWVGTLWLAPQAHFIIEHPIVEDLVRGQHKLSGSLMQDMLMQDMLMQDI